MAVVLDANVFVSAALNGRGPSAELVAALRDGRLSAVASPGLLAELRGVLRRDRFRRFLSLEEVDEHVDETARLCEVADDPGVTGRTLCDPDDEYLVALAVEAGAEAVVSRDLDLRAADLPVTVLAPPTPSGSSSDERHPPVTGVTKASEASRRPGAGSRLRVTSRA